MTIREAAARVGVSSETLRFYEKIGLIPPVPRKKSGIRYYDEKMVDYISFIMQFKKAGVPLNSIVEYVGLSAQGRPVVDEQKAILKQTREEISRKINALQDSLVQLDLRLEQCADDAVTIERKFAGLRSTSLSFCLNC